MVHGNFDDGIESISFVTADIYHSFDDKRLELLNPEFLVEAVDHFHDGDVLGSDGIHTSFLSLPPFSLVRTAISLLVGDCIFLDSLWTGGCPSWSFIALPDFALSTSAIQRYGSVEGCFLWIEMEGGVLFFDWYWFGDMFENIYVAD